jgi:hypothetical protein
MGPLNRLFYGVGKITLQWLLIWLDRMDGIAGMDGVAGLVGIDGWLDRMDGIAGWSYWLA